MSNNNKIKARIQHLHNTEAGWQEFERNSPDFIFAAGELIIYDVDAENTVPRFKIGDDTHKLSELPFTGGASTGDISLDFDAGRITEYTE